MFFIAILGFFLFAIRAVLQAWLLDATPPNMGGSSDRASCSRSRRSVAASGPFLSGLLADRFGLMAVFYFLAGTIVVANMFIFFTPAGIAHRFEPAAGPAAAE